MNSPVPFNEKCWKCGKPFVVPEFVNFIKLDDGTIHYVHGGKCSDGSLIHRGPMKDGDWWVKRVGVIQPYIEYDPEYSAFLTKTEATDIDPSTHQTVGARVDHAHRDASARALIAVTIFS